MRRFIAGLGIVLVITGLGIGFSSFVQDVAAMRPATAPLEKLDAIVALTGGSNRVDTGFDLLEKGFGKKLFISGVYRGIDVRKLLTRWKSEPQSNLDCCVVLGFEADNTASNATETVNWLRKENFHSLYLVTANYHIRRAMLEFRTLAPDLRIEAFPVTPDKIDMNSWWQTAATRSLLLREYLKYVAVYIRYKVLHL